jgi:Flp pilus assembly protein CpaB
MTGRRTLVVAVALLLGLVAGGGVYLYLRGVQARADRGARVTPVFAVVRPIPAGTSGAVAIARGMIRRSEIPERFRPPEALASLGAIRSDVATAPLEPGQIVVDGLFEPPALAASTPAEAIPKGDVAITVSLDPTQEVAGLVRPGDKVDILVEEPPGTERFLYQDVEVLALGTELARSTETTAVDPAGSATKSAPSSDLVTFAVPPAAAARIAFAASGAGAVHGSLMLALVPPGESPTAVAPVSKANEIPASLVP